MIYDSMKLMDAEVNTVCPRSLDQFYIVTLYIKWVNTSGSYSISEKAGSGARWKGSGSRGLE